MTATNPDGLSAEKERLFPLMEAQARIIAQIRLLVQRIDSHLTGAPDAPFGAPLPDNLIELALSNCAELSTVLTCLGGVAQLIGEPTSKAEEGSGSNG